METPQNANELSSYSSSIDVLALVNEFVELGKDPLKNKATAYIKELLNIAEILNEVLEKKSFSFSDDTLEILRKIALKISSKVEYTRLHNRNELFKMIRNIHIYSDNS